MSATARATDYQPVKREDHSTIRVGDYLYMWVGKQAGFPDVHNDETKKSESSVMEVWHLQSGRWEQKPTTGTPPLGVRAYAAAAIGNEIFYYGGWCGHSGCYHNSLYSFNVDTFNWKELSPTTSHHGPSMKWLCGMVAAQLDGEDYLVVIGGDGPPDNNTPEQPGAQYSGNVRLYCNEIHYYKLSSGEWITPTVIGDRPPPINQFSLTPVTNNTAILFGGETPNGDSSNVYIFDFTKTSVNCTMASNPGGSVQWPKGRYGHSSVLINNSKEPHLLVVGGMGTNDSWLFNINKRIWKQLLDTPESVTKRYFQSLSVWNVTSTANWIIVFGGGERGYTDTRVIELRYNSNEWSISEIPLDQYQEKLRSFYKVIDKEYLDKAMKEGYVLCSITKAFVLGEARVGKTSLKCALTDEKYKRESTSVIEPSVAVRCYCKNEQSWQYKQISPEEFRDRIKNAVKSKAKAKEYNKAEKSTDHPTEKVPSDTSSQKLQHQSLTKEASEVTAPASNKAKTPSSEATTPKSDETTLKSEERPNERKKHLQKIHVVKDFFDDCQKDQKEGESLYDDKHWLYFIDSGGQIQFQKLLPVFMPFASVLIVVVSLAKSLTERSEKVMHFKGEDKATKSMYTLPVEEVLKQLFSSVVPSGYKYMEFLAEHLVLSKHIKFAQQQSGSPPPKIVIIPVGTCGENCDDTLLTETKEKLNNIVKCHEKECKFMSNDIHIDILQIDGRITVDSEMVLVPDDRRSITEKSLLKISQVLNYNAYEIDVPLKWYCFDVLLHEVASEGCGILTLSFCQELGEELGMLIPEIKNALIFLHLFNKILYYHESKECSDLVFVEVNSLVNILKELVMKVYEGHLAVETVKPKWFSLVTKGQLTTENMKQVCKDASTRKYDDALKHDPDNAAQLEKARLEALQIFEDFRAQYKNPQFEVKLLKLFQELLIAAVLPSNEYFVPAILPLKDVTHDPHTFCNYPYDLSPLLFCFEAAVPMGLFCAIIVHLLSPSHVKWKLNEHKTNYSNYFALKYDVFNITLVEQLNCIELHCDDQGCQGIARKSLEEAIKSAAKKHGLSVEEAIESAVEKHSLSIYYKKGFYCLCDGAKNGKCKALNSRMKERYVIEGCRDSCDVQTRMNWLESMEHCEKFFGRDHDTESSNDMRTVAATGVQKSSKRQASVRDMASVDETVNEETVYHSKRNHLVNDEHTDDISGEEYFFRDRDHNTESSSNMRTVAATCVQKLSKRQASVRDMASVDETVNEETGYYSKRNHFVNDEHTDDISDQNPKQKTGESYKSLDPDIWEEEPKNVDLYKIFINNECWFRIIGESLGISVDGIKYNAEDPQECLSIVFKRWRSRYVNVTWKRIEQVCEDFPDQLGQVKSRLRKYLSSDKARKEYLSKN